MPGIEELRQRVEEAERRFGLIEEERLRYSERLIGLMNAIETRLQAQNAEIERLRREVADREAQIAARAHEMAHHAEENEQLREMLHGLLQAIEAGTRDALMETIQEMDRTVSALVAPAEEEDAAAQAPETRPEAETELVPQPEGDASAIAKPEPGPEPAHEPGPEASDSGGEEAAAAEEDVIEEACEEVAAEVPEDVAARMLEDSASQRPEASDASGTPGAAHAPVGEEGEEPAPHCNGDESGDDSNADAGNDADEETATPGAVSLDAIMQRVQALVEEPGSGDSGAGEPGPEDSDSGEPSSLAETAAEETAIADETEAASGAAGG
ncbi:MAG: hypothetical protein D6826_04990 [Alphaproteobacteria bacterium]|nr:MAG: hypothetical protein D6826_04990 [Alphaproteobacteria bacterium]